MTDYIERDALIRQIESVSCDHCPNKSGDDEYVDYAKCTDCHYGAEIEDIADFPAADVKPVVRGEWKPRDLTFGRSYYYCSSCEMTVDMPTAMGVPLYRFCPYCMSDNKKEDER